MRDQFQVIRPMDLDLEGCRVVRLAALDHPPLWVCQGVLPSLYPACAPCLRLRRICLRSDRAPPSGATLRDALLDPNQHPLIDSGADLPQSLRLTSLIDERRETHSRWISRFPVS